MAGSRPAAGILASRAVRRAGYFRASRISCMRLPELAAVAGAPAESVTREISARLVRLGAQVAGARQFNELEK